MSTLTRQRLAAAAVGMLLLLDAILNTTNGQLETAAGMACSAAAWFVVYQDRQILSGLRLHGGNRPTRGLRWVLGAMGLLIVGSALYTVYDGPLPPGFHVSPSRPGYAVLAAGVVTASILLGLALGAALLWARAHWLDRQADDMM